MSESLNPTTSRRTRHLAQQLGISGVVEREALEHECEQAESTLRAMQMELKQAEARLAEVQEAAAEDKKQRAPVDPAALQRAEAAQLRKLEAQVSVTTAVVKEERKELRALMSSGRPALAAAVAENVDSFFKEQHRQRCALRERHTQASDADGDAVRAAITEQEDLKRSIAQLTRRLEAQRAEAAAAVQERDALKLLLARRAGRTASSPRRA
jgi:hypothetical protein